jgi:hypothetical protein
MIRKYFILFFFIALTNISSGKSLLEKLNNGKVLTIVVEPNGDAWTDPANFHTFKIYKSDSLFTIELIKNDTLQKKIISEQLIIRIENFIQQWMDERQSLWKGNLGLQYDSIKITIGHKTKRFRSHFFSDKKLINEIFGV